MLKIGLILGLTSYAIFFFGILGFLQNGPLLFTAIVCCLLILLTCGTSLLKTNFRAFKLKRTESIVISLILMALLVALVGTLGPETSFDALWYHLTIPKIFIEEEEIFFIRNNLFYYSLMPKFTEMLFVPALLFGNEIVAKLIHYSFGLLSALMVYKICRIYLSSRFSLFGVLVYLSNLVVLWLMSTAYSDLPRHFFEFLALYCFLIFLKENKTKYYYYSSLFLGFAITVKMVSFGTIPIFLLMTLLVIKPLTVSIKKAIGFLLIAILIPLPWFVFAYINSGNPLYPLFSDLGLRGFSFKLMDPLHFANVFIDIFLFASDPINPIFIIALPFLLLRMRTIHIKFNFLLLYCLGTYFIWYIFFQEGGGRFISASFAGFILLTLVVIKEQVKEIRSIFYVTIILIAIVSILYRGIANARFLPYIFGQQSKESFLLKELNFEFGDFYDQNQEIKSIVKEETVLLRNFHNIYYVDFKYTLPEWEDANKARYILVQNGEIEGKNTRLIYKNDLTHVKLYEQ